MLRSDLAVSLRHTSGTMAVFFFFSFLGIARCTNPEPCPPPTLGLDILLPGYYYGKYGVVGAMSCVFPISYTFVPCVSIPIPVFYLSSGFVKDWNVAFLLHHVEWQRHSFSPRRGGGDAVKGHDPPSLSPLLLAVVVVVARIFSFHSSKPLNVVITRCSSATDAASGAFPGRCTT